MARVIRQRVKQREQKSDGQNDDEQIGHAHPINFDDVERTEVVLLKFIDIVKEIEGNPKDQAARQAVRQRNG